MLDKLSRFGFGYARLGVNDSDATNIRVKKIILTVSASIAVAITILWGLTSLILGHILLGSILVTYSVITFFATKYFFATKNFDRFRNTQLYLLLIVPFLLQCAVGGYTAGSNLIIWSLLAPVVAIFFTDTKQAIFWVGAYVAVVLFAGVYEFITINIISSSPQSDGMASLFYVLNNGLVGFFILAMLLYFSQENRKVREKLEVTNRQLMVAKHIAETANLAKSMFFADFSHELRTPLNAIIGYCEMLMEEAMDGHRKQDHEDLSRIHCSSMHLLSLTNNIMDMAKIEAGKMELHYETAPLDILVKEIISTTQPLFDKNNNILSVDYPVMEKINTDTMKVKQIIINLLTNSAKFTQNGKVDLKITTERHNSIFLQDQLVIKIRDQGIGMTGEQTAKVFDAFTQSDSGIARNYGGTGLGLTISRNFCRFLGGNIKIKSEPGVGSVFTVTLPIKTSFNSKEPKTVDVDTNEMTLDSAIKG